MKNSAQNMTLSLRVRELTSELEKATKRKADDLNFAKIGRLPEFSYFSTPAGDNDLENKLDN